MRVCFNITRAYQKCFREDSIKKQKNKRNTHTHTHTHTYTHRHKERENTIKLFCPTTITAKSNTQNFCSTNETKINC